MNYAEFSSLVDASAKNLLTHESAMYMIESLLKIRDFKESENDLFAMEKEEMLDILFGAMRHTGGVVAELVIMDNMKMAKTVSSYYALYKNLYNAINTEKCGRIAISFLKSETL